MDALDYCEHLVETWPNRWTGSPGERESGDWMEAQLAAMGYETRQMRFPCPGWEFEGEEMYLEGRPIEAGAQFYSVGCDVTAPLAPVRPDGTGGFSGDVAGRIALVRESETNEVTDRNPLLLNLEAAGAVGAVMQSVLPDTYSTKMFRTPESKLPAMGVSGEVGPQLFEAAGKDVRMVIRARQTESTTGNVFGEKGPEDGPVILVCAHHEASPNSPGASDDASGIGVVLAIAQRFAGAECGARLRFVGWGGHEFGVFGSKWYVDNCRDEALKVKRLLVFDVVGAPDSRPRISVCGSEGLQRQVGAYAERRSDVAFVVRNRGGGDASTFVPIGVEAVSIGSDCSGRRPPTHSPMDDLRWVDRANLDRCVDVGVELVKEWMGQFGVTCRGV
ncbi:MAG: M28 family peptidase [Candidatus Brocadiaceae bacterium]|nr:M28 family peptidase [Candidatus Brocadiaceae bacterium]